MVKSYFTHLKLYSIKMWIYMIVFSLIVSKSIFITPFTFANGILGVVLGILICLVLFILSTLILYFVGKVNLKDTQRNTSFARTFLYMIPGIIMSTIIFLGIYPAIIPYDTAYIYFQSKTSAFSNMHPIVYTMFIDFFADRFDTLSIVVIIQIIYCAFTYGYIGYVMEKNRVSKKLVWATVTIISLMPVNVIYSVTIIKDVPYIVPLMFITAIIFDMILSDRINAFHIIGLIITSIVVWCSRFNALLTIPAIYASIILMYMIRKQIKRALLIIASFILVAAGYYGCTQLAVDMTNGEYFIFEGTSTTDIMPSLMVTSIGMEKKAELSEEETAFIKKYVKFGPIQVIEEKKEGLWQFNYNFMAMMDTQLIESNRKEYYSNAIPLILKYPATALTAYERLTAIVWAVPNYGYTTVRNRDVCDAFEINHPPTNPISAKVYDFQMNSPIYSGTELYFLWRPALWMLLALLLLPLAIKKHGYTSLVLISPMVFNAAGYMVANPSQNVRYMYLNVTVFVIFTVYTMMKSRKTKDC